MTYNNDWKPTEINERQSVNSTFDWSTSRIQQPKTICRCDLFGQGQLVISFGDTGVKTFPVPNRWIRFWTRVFFNSKWELSK